MSILDRWQKEPGARVGGSRDLDRSKVQAPGVVAIPSGGFRLFYTAVGPAKPFAACQGYILSAISEDGLLWERRTCIVEGAGYGGPGLDAVHAEDMSLIWLEGNRYRMYYAACDRNGIWRVASAATSRGSHG